MIFSVNNKEGPVPLKKVFELEKPRPKKMHCLGRGWGRVLIICTSSQNTHTHKHTKTKWQNCPQMWSDNIVCCHLQRSKESVYLFSFWITLPPQYEIPWVQKLWFPKWQNCPQMWSDNIVCCHLQRSKLKESVFIFFFFFLSHLATPVCNYGFLSRESRATKFFNVVLFGVCSVPESGFPSLLKCCQKFCLSHFCLTSSCGFLVSSSHLTKL